MRIWYVYIYIGMSVLSSQTAEATEVKLGRNVGLDLRISVFFCDLDPRPVSYTHLTLPTIYSV